MGYSILILGWPKLDKLDFIDSKYYYDDLFMYLIILLKGLGSVYEKFDAWTGPKEKVLPLKKHLQTVKK